MAKKKVFWGKSVNFAYFFQKICSLVVGIENLRNAEKKRRKRGQLSGKEYQKISRKWTCTRFL